MTDNGLPIGWERRKLADICEVILGQSPPGHTYNSQGLGLPFFQGKAEFGSLHPTAVKWCTEPSKIAEANDVLLSVRAPVGPTNLAIHTCCIGRGLAALRAKNGVLPKYVLYGLRATTDELASKATGSTFSAVSGAVVRRHMLPVAPYDEQKQIVDEIETQFARLDDAVAALQRARTRLRRYRASVLKAACEGRLVPTEAELARREGRDYEPASVLLDRLRAAREASATGKRRTNKKTLPLDTSTLAELPEGWIWTTLSDLLALPLSNGRSVPTADEGFPVLRLTALKNGTIDLREKKVGDWTEEEASRFLVAGGDFLVSRGNGSLKLVGQGGLVPENPDRVAFPDTLIRVRPIAAAVAPPYLASLWNSALVRDQIESTARTTAGIYKVNQSDLSDVRLPLPPVAEQERIVGELERRFSVIAQLEASVEANLKRSEAMRQAILRKAFSGGLSA